MKGAAAAAAAKLLQSCRSLCEPIDGSPPGEEQNIHHKRHAGWITLRRVLKVKLKVLCSLPGRQPSPKVSEKGRALIKAVIQKD